MRTHQRGGGDKVIILTKGGNQICKITLKKVIPLLSKFSDQFQWDPKKDGYTLRFEFDVNIFRENLATFFKGFFNSIANNDIISLLPYRPPDYPMLKTANEKNNGASDECRELITNGAKLFDPSPVHSTINRFTVKTLFLDQNGNVSDKYKTFTIVLRLTADNDNNTLVTVLTSDELDTYELPCGDELLTSGDTRWIYVTRYTYKKDKTMKKLVPVLKLSLEEVLKKISADNPDPDLKTYLEKNQITIT